jgi:hypothetical protein
MLRFEDRLYTNPTFVEGAMAAIKASHSSHFVDDDFINVRICVVLPYII